MTTPEKKITKAEAARILGKSERAVERYTASRRLSVSYDRGRTKDVPLYVEREVRELADELRGPKQRAVTPAIARPRTGSVERMPSIATQSDNADTGQALVINPHVAAQFAEMIAAAMRPVMLDARPVDTRPLWLTREEALKASGLPVTVFAQAVKRGAVVKQFKGRAVRYSRDDVLALAESFRGNGHE